jgi:hypothetical protein
MFVLLAYLFVVLICGGFLTICGLLAIWVAFGSTPVSIRLPIFLVGTLPLGMVFWISQFDAIVYLICLVISFIAAVAFERVWSRSALFVLLIAIPSAATLIEHDFYNVGMLSRFSLAIMLTGGLLSMLRLFGVRLVHLCPDRSDQEIEIATGRSLDSWVALLDENVEGYTNHAERARFIREQGFDEYWQKEIVVAYEQIEGRRPIHRSPDGRAFTVAPRFVPWGDAIGLQLRQHRFSIRQMMAWSVAAAIMFGFFRLFAGLERIRGDEISVGIPAICIMAFITILIAYGILAVRRRLPFPILFLLSAVAAAAFPWQATSMPGFSGHSIFLVAGAAGYACCFAFSLLIARKQGYRLVRLVDNSLQRSVALSRA